DRPPAPAHVLGVARQPHEHRALGLDHHERTRRGRGNTAAKRERRARDAEYMRRRWGAILDADPAYNPNLALDGDSYSLAFPPRVRRPWLAAPADDVAEQAESIREAESA